jgi:recombination protein RecA
MGDSVMGMQARLMSQALRKLTSNISKSKTSIIFINQIRHKIGVMWGNPETTTGGLALKFYASVRLDIRRVESVKKGDEIIGSKVRVKVVKNKIAPPFKQAEFDILFGQGIDRAGYLVDMGVVEGLVDKSGAFYSYQNEKIGQGRDNAKQYLQDNPKIADEIEFAIRQKYIVSVAAAEAVEPKEEKPSKISKKQ